jgi:alpha-1,2-mannosyltransferase
MRPGALSHAYGIRLLFEPRVQRIGLITLLVVFLSVRVYQLFYFSDVIQWGYDLSFYWRAGQRVLDDQPIYAAFQLAGPYPPQGVDYEYLYPPFLAVAVAPLVALVDDHRFANWLWAGMGAVLVAMSVIGVARREAKVRGGDLVLLVGAAFAYAPVVSELIIGNVHLLILGLLAGAWLGISRETPRGELAAGILVGLAALIKVFPGLIVIWFLLTNRFRAAAAAFVTMAVLAVVTLPVVGVGPWLDYPTVLANLGAPTELTDVLAPAVWLSAIMPPVVAQAVVTAVGLAVVAWTALRRTAAISFAVAATVSVLIAPALYPHYLAILVLPLLIALQLRVPVALLGLVFLSGMGGGPEVFGDLAWIINRAFPIIGAMLLVGGLIWVGQSGGSRSANVASP